MIKLIFINRDDYNQLTTRNKIKRADKFANMIKEIHAEGCSEHGLKIRAGTIRNHMFPSDLAYMTEQEINLFRTHGFIDENNNILK